MKKTNSHCIFYGDVNKISSALLFSTDIQLPVTEICHYYKVRFQIEFLFRDTKQYTGL